MTIKIIDNKFFCSVCGTQLTIFGENHGKGFRARCKPCKKNYFYPACEDCGQPAWNHSQEDHDAFIARSSGKGYCRKCKTAKELEDFNIKNDKPSSRCKDCQAQYFKDWYSKNKPENNSGVTDEQVLNDLFGEW